MKQRKYMFFVDVTHLPTGEVSQDTIEELVRESADRKMQEHFFRDATERACDRARKTAKQTREGIPRHEHQVDLGSPPTDFSARVFSVVDIT
jgi:hypothetical protein